MNSSNGCTKGQSNPPRLADFDAERWAIGSALCSAEGAAEVCGALTADDFTDDAHRILFRAIDRLHRQGVAGDPALLIVELRKLGPTDRATLDAVGGNAFIVELAKGEYRADHGKRYAELVREASDRRKMNAVGEEIQRILAEGGGLEAALQVATEGVKLLHPSRDTGPRIESVEALRTRHPVMPEVSIEGLARRGETGNLIAATKKGKTWLVILLALCKALGLDWLGTFRCIPGRVLIIDNELHPAVLVSRIRTVAEAMGIQPEEYRGRIDILSLRGRLLDLNGIAGLLAEVEPGTYDLVIFDAWYRGIPAGVSENDNAQIAGLYNLIDQTTARLNCPWWNVHHASKGDQSSKSVTDVGAGAGSQSRAVDCHIVLRDHEEEGVSVMDTVVRSFPPPAPIALRFTFPLWQVDGNIDTGKLKGLQSTKEKKQNQNDAEGMALIAGVLEKGAATRSVIRNETGLSPERINRLLGMMKRDELVNYRPTTAGGNKTEEWFAVGGCRVVDEPNRQPGDGGVVGLLKEGDRQPPPGKRKRKKRPTTLSEQPQ